MSAKFSNILKNNWVVTLTATLLGVFVALYLNEWVASNKLFQQKEIATENIIAEIAANKTKVEESLVRHYEVLDIMSFLGEYLSENNELVAPPSNLQELKGKYPNFLTITDSTKVADNLYEYNGEMNLDLSFPQVDLTTIAWNTLKGSEVSTTYGFECLMYLETVDNLTGEAILKNKELIDFFTGTKEKGDNNGKLINHLKLLIDYEEMLSEVYNNCEEELKNCGN